MERHGRYYDDKNCHDIKSSTSPSYFFSPTATENSIECYIYSLMLCANESFRTHDNKTTCRVLFHCHLWYRIQKHRIVLFFFQYYHLFFPEYCDFFSPTSHHDLLISLHPYYWNIQSHFSRDKPQPVPIHSQTSTHSSTDLLGGRRNCFLLSHGNLREPESGFVQGVRRQGGLTLDCQLDVFGGFQHLLLDSCWNLENGEGRVHVNGHNTFHLM